MEGMGLDVSQNSGVRAWSRSLCIDTAVTTFFWRNKTPWHNNSEWKKLAFKVLYISGKKLPNIPMPWIVRASFFWMIPSLCVINHQDQVFFLPRDVRNPDILSQHGGLLSWVVFPTELTMRHKSKLVVFLPSGENNRYLQPPPTGIFWNTPQFCGSRRLPVQNFGTKNTSHDIGSVASNCWCWSFSTWK